MSDWGTQAWFEREFRASDERADPWGHEWRGSQQVRHTRLLRLLVPLLAGDGTAVLDIGCSYGALTAQLQRLNPAGLLVGMDVSERAVRVARRRVPSARFIVASLPDCALTPERFDLALASEVSYYLPGAARAAAVAAIYRAIRPGGRLVFSSVLDDGVRYFTAESALSLLAPRFSVERIEYGHSRWYDHWETRWLVLERRLSRAVRTLEDESEFAAWQGEHGASVLAEGLRRVRQSPTGRRAVRFAVFAARACVRWLLGRQSPVRALSFVAGRLGRGQSNIAIVARRVIASPDWG